MNSKTVATKNGKGMDNLANLDDFFSTTLNTINTDTIYEMKNPKIFRYKQVSNESMRLIYKNICNDIELRTALAVISNKTNTMEKCSDMGTNLVEVVFEPHQQHCECGSPFAPPSSTSTPLPRADGG